MSKMGSYVFEVQEIVDPMVYTGYTDKSIIEQVLKELPHTPESWIKQEISRARFDYCELGVYE